MNDMVRVQFKISSLVIILAAGCFIASCQDQSKSGQNDPSPHSVMSPATMPAVTNALGMKLDYIPAGNFVMGSPTTEQGRNRGEIQHKVTLTASFYMASTTVTQAQWKAVMGNNPSHFQEDDYPVEEVSYDDAAAFCRKLSDMEKKHYRLPTEAEWEYGCRAGTTTRYNTGDDWTALHDAAWFFEDSDMHTHAVGKKKPNAWGLYDMHGNVWQWCSDWYSDYTADNVTDPRPSTGQYRILRGGPWDGAAIFCRSAFRGYTDPDYRHHNVGFRVVLDVN